MTFTELVTEIMDRMNFSSTEATVRIGRAVNRKYKLVTTSIGLQLSRRGLVQENATAGVSVITFSNVEKIINVVDRSVTPYRVLSPVTLEEIEEDMPFPEADGPTKYAVHSHTSDSVTIIINRIPATALSLYADAHRTVDDLSGSNEPAFPESFHDILIEGVMSDEYRKLEKANFAIICQKEYERILSDLKFWIIKDGYQDTWQGKMAQNSFARPNSSGGGGSGSSSIINGAGTADTYVKWTAPTTIGDALLKESGNTLFLHETAHTRNSSGFVINQLTADDHILTFKSSDVTTGLITVPAQDVETNDFACFTKNSVTSGGLRIQSLHANDSSPSTMTIISFGGTADTTKSSVGRGLIEIYGVQHNGADVIANTTANGNVFAVRTRVAGADTTLFLIDEDGDTWQGGTVSAVGGTFSGTVAAVNGSFSGDLAVSDDITCDDLAADAIAATSVAATGSITAATVTASSHITSTAGNLALTAGTIALGGGQIAFPAVQNASADVNTLDDYKEANWTPIIIGTGGGSGQTYDVQVGRYTKIGKLVTVYGRITLTALGTVTTQAAIGALPFAIENVANGTPAVTIGYFSALTASVVYLGGFGVPGTTTIALFHLLNDGTGMTGTVQADLSNTTDIVFTMSYLAA